VTIAKLKAHLGKAAPDLSMPSSKPLATSAGFSSGTMLSKRHQQVAKATFVVAVSRL